MASLAPSRVSSSSTTFSTQRKPIPAHHEVNGSNAQNLVSSPSQGNPPKTSRWGVGWKTTSMMISFYTFAVLIACAHLSLFLYLNEKRADGEDRAAPQSYVNTASNILAAAFSLSIKIPLAIAFTQLLWYRLRISTMKVSTIESLFGVRSNPLLLFDWSVLTNGLIPVIIVVFIWSIQLAVTFPLGALTIITTTRSLNQTKNIPTFNASFFGNSSGFDAQRFSFDGFSVLSDNVTLVPNSIGSNKYVKEHAAYILTSGIPTNMPSPCGANCSFQLSIDIPYMQCNTNTSHGEIPDISLGDTGELSFIAGWTSFTGIFNVFIFFNNPLNQTTNLTCLSARASYNLDVKYTNNLLTIQPFLASVSPLNLTVPILPGADLSEDALGTLYFPGFMETFSVTHPFYGLQALNWTPPIVSWYRDRQLLAIIDGMASSLDGMLDEFGDQGEEGILRLGPITIIDYTRFNTLYNIYPQQIPPTIYNQSNLEVWQGQVVGNLTGSVDGRAAGPTQRLIVTQDLLNEALFNITMSLIPNFGWWNTTDTVVTITEAVNIYQFSRPLNLIIPYFLTLLLAIPILAIGVFALLKNGVSAVDGGFLQLATTTFGSPTLERLAAGACLGGSESVPQDLKDLEIRFGELVGCGSEGKEGVRRAGFGTRDETIPLTKGMFYGA